MVAHQSGNIERELSSFHCVGSFNVEISQKLREE